MSENLITNSSRLIVLDGLPGSGKTTTGKWLTSWLQQHGANARWLPENEISHPLWWYDHWNGREYQTPDFEKTSVETFMQTSLGKWRDFVTQKNATMQLSIAESVFFQNAVTMFLMGDAKPAKLIEYAQDVQGLVQPLQPILIYFCQADPAAAFSRICALRGQGFETELIRNMEQFPYLKQRNLHGRDGVARLWREIGMITDRLFNESDLHKLLIETSQGNWQGYRQQILEFLGLLPVST
jgi:hypothetical protein